MNSRASQAPIVLAAGGTGGHIFPAQSVAEELQARGRRLVLVTDRRGAGYSGALAELESHHISAGTPLARGPRSRDRTNSVGPRVGTVTSTVGAGITAKQRVVCLSSELQ